MYDKKHFTKNLMEAIRHFLLIKTTPEKVFQAITTEEGLKSWWAKQAIARPEPGFVNVFTFGKFRNEFKVTKLVPNQIAEWLCIHSIEEWIGTTVSFDVEKKDGNSILRFSHSGWKEASDTFAKCNYDWAHFMKSLKLLCETGEGTPL
jgi:uncharacterized protein YndB with AHSA1/START domain